MFNILMIIEQLDQIHMGRDPDLIRLKRSKMAHDPVAFFRGSANLFYDELYRSLQFQSPWGWVCGDVHAENFGTFTGLNNQVYFDINDFDEAGRGQIHWDVVRLMTSIAIVYRTSGGDEDIISDVIKYIQRRYIQMLLDGKVGNLCEPNKDSPIQKHINSKLTHKHQKKFIKKHVDNCYIIRSDEFVDLLPSCYHDIEKAIGEVIHHFRGARIHDIVGHVSGNSSLGLQRYTILIQGYKEGAFHLLDVKQATNTILPAQPNHTHWNHNAGRIVSIQKMMQANSPLLLSTITIGDSSYVIKEIQPTEDKIVFDPTNKHKINHQLIDDMLYVLVCSQLRACDIMGSLSLTDIMQYGYNMQSDESIYSFVLQYADLNQRRYSQFCDELGG